MAAWEWARRLVGLDKTDGVVGENQTLSGVAKADNVRIPRPTGETGSRDRIIPVTEYSFVKGHGTENDFVLIPDANGNEELWAEQVAQLCDRRSGIGADGVIRVVRTDATEDPAAQSLTCQQVWSVFLS